MSVKTTLKNKFSRTVLKAQKHSPTLLFGVGIIGVVSTAVLASRATLKMSEVLDGIDAKKSEHEMTKFETDKESDKALTKIHLQGAIDIARLYAPAVLVGALTVASLTTSHIVLNKRYAGATAAFATLDKAYREFQARVRDEFGAEKEAELRHGLVDKEIVEEGEHGPEVKVIKAAGPNGLSLYARCFDETNKNWKGHGPYNRDFIMTVQNYAGDKLRDRGHLFLNEVYDMLGMERTYEGQHVGWMKGYGDEYVSFGVFSGDQFMGERFVMGDEMSVWLDFNVSSILDKF